MKYKRIGMLVAMSNVHYFLLLFFLTKLMFRYFTLNLLDKKRNTNHIWDECLSLNHILGNDTIKDSDLDTLNL